jgi:hypothetical protein
MNALKPMFFSEAEYKRREFIVEAPAGCSVEEVMAPDFLQHVARKLQEGSMIEVCPSDSRWWAKLMVRKVDLAKHEVHCWKLQYVDLEAQETAKPVGSNFAVKFGGAHRWRVIRLSDNEVIHHGEPTEAAAKAWLEEYTPA